MLGSYSQSFQHKWPKDYPVNLGFKNSPEVVTVQQCVKAVDVYNRLNRQTNQDSEH